MSVYLSRKTLAALTTDLTLLVSMMTIEISAPGCDSSRIRLAFSARCLLRHARTKWMEVSLWVDKILSATVKPTPLWKKFDINLYYKFKVTVTSRYAMILLHVPQSTYFFARPIIFARESTYINLYSCGLILMKCPIDVLILGHEKKWQICDEFIFTSFWPWEFTRK